MRKLLLYFESGCNGSVTGLRKNMRKVLNYSSIRNVIVIGDFTLLLVEDLKGLH